MRRRSSTSCGGTGCRAPARVVDERGCRFVTELGEFLPGAARGCRRRSSLTGISLFLQFPGTNLVAADNTRITLIDALDHKAGLTGRALSIFLPQRIGGAHPRFVALANVAF